MSPHSTLTLARWLRSVLFRSYLWDFLLLWLLVKGVNVLVARFSGLPMLAFRSGSEIIACGIELLALREFIRRRDEDILLANLGWPVAAALAPLVLVHIVLSLILSLAS